MARVHPLTGEPKTNGHSRFALDQLLSNGSGRREARARYDAAQTTDEFKNYWSAADSFDADSSNSKAVRETLVPRSRYEIGNNGYADGVAQTYATDLIGTGPQLRMETRSLVFNELVERRWRAWAKSIHLRRKMWCLAHAKHSDGEGIAVFKTNPNARDPVKVDLRLYETEQCQTPVPKVDEPGYIDGIEFDEFGNPTFYDILPLHPGGQWGYLGNANVEKIPARFVSNWFKLRRPGQHRGVPESASTLNCGAAARRWREATIAAAETYAEYTLFIKTMFQPDEMDAVSPMSTLDIQKRMMTALPMGWDVSQLSAEQPGNAFEPFDRALIREQARPRNMPFNKAAGDSSDYNYASGRLDHQTYYASLDVDREDCNDLLLDPLFDVWYSEAILVYNWFRGRPDEVGPEARAHSWDWPKHRVVDVEADANANNTRLRNGSLSLSTFYAESGVDFTDELVKMASDYGVSPDEMRGILRRNLFPVNEQQQQNTSSPGIR